MSQSNENQSLQRWITDSRDGDESALNQLAEYLLPKAFGLASQKMYALSPMDDYEDIAISAVKSICLRFRHGESEFLGEKELGSLLRQFVVGKIRDRRKYHHAEKRNIKKSANGQLPPSNEAASQLARAFENQAVVAAQSVWLDEEPTNLPAQEKEYLENMLGGLGSDVRGLFSELVKRLDEKPRKVLMLITQDSMSNMELAEALDCAPTSIDRYRRAIRKKLEEIVNA